MQSTPQPSRGHGSPQRLPCPTPPSEPSLPLATRSGPPCTVAHLPQLILGPLVPLPKWSPQPNLPLSLGHWLRHLNSHPPRPHSQHTTRHAQIHESCQRCLTNLGSWSNRSVLPCAVFRVSTNAIIACHVLPSTFSRSQLPRHSACMKL